MQNRTKKLIGAARDRFLARLRREPEIATLVTSLRVLRSGGASSGPRHDRLRRVERSRDVAASSRDVAASQMPQHVAATVVPVPPAAVPMPAARVEAPFDPYAIGLVPIHQREGANGLLQRLAGIALVDQLRQLARAQNIILPSELRSGDASLDVVRSAIVAAVGRRIADRRSED